jgi:DNA-binding IclR family transcriptional regulator
MSAIARGVQLLQCFTIADRELSSRELMQRSGLSRATLFRLTTSLRQLRLLRYHPDRGTFSLGLRLLATAAPVLSRLPVRRMAYPLMQSIADSFDAQVILTVGEQDDLVAVEIARTATTNVLQISVGMRLSLSLTATGQAYLAALQQDEREEIVTRLIEAAPERARGLPERLVQAASQIAAQGFCLVRSEIMPGVSGVAAALRTSVDGEVVVFGCSLLALHEQDDRVEQAGLRIASLARNMEAVMNTGPDLPDSSY